MGPELVDLWPERTAILTTDTGLSVDLAERAAFLDVREQALTPIAGLVAALVGADLGPVLLVERRSGRREAGSTGLAHALAGSPSPDLAGPSFSAPIAFELKDSPLCPDPN